MHSSNSLDTNIANFSWKELSEYIILIINRLADSVDNNERDLSTFREKLILDLQSLKEGMRKELCKCQDKHEGGLKEALDNVESLITKLSDRTYSLEKENPLYIIDQKINSLKETHLTPLRIRVAVLSLIGGAVGGVIMTIVISYLQYSITQ